MVGPFFCIEDKIYAHLVPLTEAESYGACLTTSVSHLDFWDKSLAHNFPGVEYDFFPRGRVVYKQGLFILYVDCCLDYLPAIEAILSAFMVGGEHAWTIDYDEHYQCAACAARANGEVVFDSAVREIFKTGRALEALQSSQYLAFEMAMQQAHDQIYRHMDMQIRVSVNGHIQFMRQGAPYYIEFSKPEQQVAELTYKAALAKVLDKRLVVFRPAAYIHPPTYFKVHKFLESLPREQVIISAPFERF